MAKDTFQVRRSCTPQRRKVNTNQIPAFFIAVVLVQLLVTGCYETVVEGPTVIGGLPNGAVSVDDSEGSTLEKQEVKTNGDAQP